MSALQSTLTLQGSIQTSGGGSLSYGPPSLVNPNSVGELQTINLAANTWTEVTLQPNTQWFAVIPPPGNAIALSFKWLTGDTGVNISAPLGMPCVAVDQSQLTFWIRAESTLAVNVWSA